MDVCSVKKVRISLVQIIEILISYRKENALLTNRNTSVGISEGVRTVI